MYISADLMAKLNILKYIKKKEKEKAFTYLKRGLFSLKKLKLYDSDPQKEKEEGKLIISESRQAKDLSLFFFTRFNGG